MKSSTLHRQMIQKAQLGGFNATYWPVCSISLANDRTPELQPGSTKDTMM
jgi:hypothetical protein